LAVQEGAGGLGNIRTFAVHAIAALIFQLHGAIRFPWSSRTPQPGKNTGKDSRTPRRIRRANIRVSDLQVEADPPHARPE